MERTTQAAALLIALAWGATAGAQTKKASSPYDDMLDTTARVLVIDSVVVEDDGYLQSMPIGGESGRLLTYEEFWNDSGQPGCYAYVNEFGNWAVFSRRDEGGRTSLYTADRLEGKWTNVTPARGLDEGLWDANHPFMMPDGVTLYFTAAGTDNLGGHDIYVTTYDADSARFNKPENMGLPYNSSANDLYLAVDEFNSLGYLVTDRRQEEGKVCVYTFVPPTSRRTYMDEGIGEARLRSLADLESIEDTWYDRAQVDAARQRKERAMRQRRAQGAPRMEFFINDAVVYTSDNDFRLGKNRERYAELCQGRESLEADMARLEDCRMRYAQGGAVARDELSREIPALEEDVARRRQYLKELEKDIRNTENMAIEGH